MRTRRQFTAELKAQGVLEGLSGRTSAAEVCPEHHVKPDLLSRWKADCVGRAPSVFGATEQRQHDEQRIAAVERLVGRLSLELAVAQTAARLCVGTRS